MPAMTTAASELLSTYTVAPPAWMLACEQPARSRSRRKRIVGC
jgi:hypothetical protein